jgi:hypothetical protein
MWTVLVKFLIFDLNGSRWKIQIELEKKIMKYKGPINKLNWWMAGLTILNSERTKHAFNPIFLRIIGQMKTSTINIDNWIAWLSDQWLRLS